MIRVSAISKMTLLSLFIASPAFSYALNWNIDESVSILTLAMPDQAISLNGTAATVRVRNQTTANSGDNVWDVGNRAWVDGTISSDITAGGGGNYANGSISFTGGTHSMVGLTTTTPVLTPPPATDNHLYRPNPAAFNSTSTNTANPNGQFTNTTTAPGVFGARVRATVTSPFTITVDAAYISFLDVDYDLASTGAVPISGGSFAANQLSMGIADTHIAFDGLSIILVGQLIPDSVGTQLTVPNTLNSLASAGSVTQLSPTQLQMTIPVNVPIVLNLSGVTLNASVAGSIVAYALIPEPATAVLLTAGIAGLAAYGRRRATR